METHDLVIIRETKFGPNAILNQRVKTSRQSLILARERVALSVHRHHD
jgi:hypothetical protein